MKKNKEEIINTLRKNQARILQYGVHRLGLFGSYARNENTELSDVDFLVEFETVSFDRYMDLKFYLEDLFNCHVDLVLSKSIKPRLRESILKEVIYV
ncbi:MAG: nucleotidyltransferase family protein [Elusimicrobia bacterium]|nr:nucleotidyltransferase family protein [Elusimicrobiota bacterium]